MILGDAEGIGSTLNLGASINALAQTLAQLEADLRVQAVSIVATLTTHTASLDLVMGISNVSHGADTFSGIADGPGATRSLGAEVLALALLATVAIGTLHSLIALALVGILAELTLNGLTATVGISSMSRETQALECARSIQAGCIETTRLVGTLVHILAANVGITTEALRAKTGDVVAHSTALGIGSTTIRLADVLALRSTALVGIAKGSGIAGAPALTQAVLAVSVLSTSWRALGLLDGRHTDQIGITHKVRFADALSVVPIAGGSNTADHSLAPLLAPSIDADLSLATRSGG